MKSHTYRALMLASSQRKSLRHPRFTRSMASHLFNSPLPMSPYRCDVDAEPLHRYQPGGLHPLELGDVLKNGRYEIIHKLGWGGYSTAWAAKDKKKNQYVAIKVLVSELSHQHEIKILQAISTLPNGHPGRARLNQMLDYFSLPGPNGTHDCLVLQLLGPGVADIVESYCEDNRLPAPIAKSFARQALQGLDFLAHHSITHGDIHTRNLAIEIPNLHSLDERSFISMLGQPQTGAVKRMDGKALDNNIPYHIVRPARFQNARFLLSHNPSIRIIDFGEAFLKNRAPRTLHTPLALRPPEAIFGDILSQRVDLWSAGCLIFELVTGQPPFDTVMLTTPILVQQMMEFATDVLPPRWELKWKAMAENLSREEESLTLHQWLEEVYFDGNKHPEFSVEDIAKVAELISKMLRFEPSKRATASQLLTHDWFR
ncbi:unnamed protein product [Clonostachys rosea]|uniref:non-specific serine/threonine protein kinase n=1 Tax=Bionectria ochroleuca TaxID=29856 RepID=A0ABY6UYE0_BIOOC|nr:unnamed protein product [Clonostachys rosea]